MRRTADIPVRHPRGKVSNDRRFRDRRRRQGLGRGERTAERQADDRGDGGEARTQAAAGSRTPPRPALVAKAAKLFTDFPETKREYFAIFKDKESPSGRKYLYQIHHNAGAKKRMVSWVFYPIGDKLVLGDMN